MCNHELTASDLWFLADGMQAGDDETMGIAAPLEEEENIVYEPLEVDPTLRPTMSAEVSAAVDVALDMNRVLEEVLARSDYTSARLPGEG